MNRLKEVKSCCIGCKGHIDKDTGDYCSNCWQWAEDLAPPFDPKFGLEPHNDKSAVLEPKQRPNGRKRVHRDKSSPLPVPDWVVPHTGSEPITPLECSESRAKTKSTPNKDDIEPITLSPTTVDWIKQYIPSLKTMHNHRVYTPYRECPPSTRIDKLLRDYLLTPPTPLDGE